MIGGILRYTASAKKRVADADILIEQRALQYRALRLPVMLDRQGEILRALDVAGLLRNDLLVVGTNAFAAYEVLCGMKFPAGNELAQGFRRRLVPWLGGVAGPVGAGPRCRKPQNADGCATQQHRACPLYVPDPRWRALHKLWLSKKPERNAQKRPKDARQGEVLLDACRYFLADAYPLDIDFVLNLPEELRDLFKDWTQSIGFDPANPT
jgi:hypothetical protein